MPWDWIALVVVLACVGAFRWRLMAMPLERDEGEYAYMGLLMLNHIPPYAVAYNMKFPGIYAAYALIMQVFGLTPAAIRLGLLLTNLATIVLVFVLARRWLGKVGAVAAALSYAMLSSCYGVLGFMAHATQFQVLMLMLGLVLLDDSLREQRVRGVFLSGMVLGLAVLMKQPGVFFLPLAFLWVVGVTRGAFRTRSAVALVLGSALPLLATFGFLLHAGVFGSFWFWCVDYARSYAANMDFAERAQKFSRNWLTLFWPWIGLLIFMAVGLLACFTREVPRHVGRMILGLFICGALATAAGGYFRHHYFVPWLPGVALAVGLAIARGFVLMPRWWQRGLLAACLLASVGRGIWTERGLLWMDPDNASRLVYTRENPFTEAQEVGEYLRQVSAPTDKVFVYGSEPEICFYARRLAATGYLYMYPLAEDQPYAQRMARQMMDEVEKADPRWMVLVQTVYGYDKPSNLVPVRDWLGTRLPLYHLVAFVPIGPHQIFGVTEIHDPKKDLPPGNHGIFVLKRNGT